jgi:hypothetical protein
VVRQRLVVAIDFRGSGNSIPLLQDVGWPRHRSWRNVSSHRDGKSSRSFGATVLYLPHLPHSAALVQDAAKGNPLKFYQLWLNLPKRSKGAPAGYTMSWAEQLVKVPGEGGATASVFAGELLLR